jgi:hypothetical protein
MGYYGITLPIDSNIFQRGLKPPTRFIFHIITITICKL